MLGKTDLDAGESAYFPSVDDRYLAAHEAVSNPRSPNSHRAGRNYPLRRNIKWRVE